MHELEVSLEVALEIALECLHPEGSAGLQAFGFGQHPDPHQWRAELHLYYVAFPELCGACACCQPYDALWTSFVQTEVSGSITRDRLPELLEQWYAWGKQQPTSCEQAQRLCYGPKLSVEVFDRATIQGVRFSTTKTEGKKKSRESVVLMKYEGKLWAGRARFFLVHTPPGIHPSPDSGVLIAHVKWYNDVSAREQATTVFGCPVFRTSFKAGKGTCNLWPIDKLAPCQLGAVYHKKRKNRLVILNRFASFLDTVPE
ncbi:hypothetical protein ABBQ38_006453 [Trebouxia sp. C0009 RCD-2024]